MLFFHRDNTNFSKIPLDYYRMIRNSIPCRFYRQPGSGSFWGVLRQHVLAMREKAIYEMTGMEYESGLLNRHLIPQINRQCLFCRHRHAFLKTSDCQCDDVFGMGKAFTLPFGNVVA